MQIHERVTCLLGNACFFQVIAKAASIGCGVMKVFVNNSVRT